MNSNNNLRAIQLRGMAAWLLTLLALLGIGTLLPDWLIQLFTLLVGLTLIAPIAGFFGLRWWLGRTLVQGQCPVCAAPLSGLKNSRLNCPSCGESLQVSQGKFIRLTPPGTVDVEVISSQSLDE